MNKIILAFTFAFFALSAKSQITYAGLGYTYGNERFTDLNYFGSSAKTLNNGQPVINNNNRSFITLRAGLMSPIKKEYSFFYKAALLLSTGGGNPITTNDLKIKSKTSYIDLYAGIGLGTTKIGRYATGFYGLIGPTVIASGLDITGTKTTLNNTYNSAQVKLNYGAGISAIGEGGFGIALDAMFNASKKGNTTTYQSGSNKRIPSDYDLYNASPTTYNAAYVTQSLNYWRINLSLFFKLSSN